MHSLTRTSLRTLAASFALLLAVPATLHAQDTRTVTEPVFPAVCSQVQADLTISAGEPSSELNTATDTTAIQTALKNCAQGQAVELVANGANTAFVIAPIYVPAGVTLLVDGGVTVFGSRNAADYQIPGNSSTCGTSDNGSACYPLITLGQNAVNGSTTTYYSATQPVTGLMGYGIINGRGADKLITISGQTVTVGANSPYDLANSGTEDVPVLVYSYKTANTVLYKITLLNSPHFHVRVTGTGNLTGGKYLTALTIWGIKLLAPWSGHNTDGIDPTGANSVSIVNSVIGDGDDESAISGSSASANFTYNNLLLTSGHGLSIGSITTNGVSNVQVTNVNFSGQAADGNQIALRIKSYCGSGGPVTGVSYQNVCMQNVATTLDLDPFYDTTSSTTSCPAFGTAAAPITFSNVYLGTAGIAPGKINLQGLNATTGLSNIVLNNIFANESTLKLAIQQSDDKTATPANDTITLNGSFYPAQWGALANSTNAVTETVNGTAATAFSTTYCANAFPALVGELYASTTASGTTTKNVNQATTLTLPATVTLNAMLQPTNPTTAYGAAAAAPVPTANVQFLDGNTVVGSGTLGSNGTLATVTLTNPTAGTHSYTASYIGDTNYAVTPFGASTYTGTQGGAMPAPTPLVITVNAGPASQLTFSTAPAGTITYGTGPGTVRVIAGDVAGDALTTLTGTVTLTVAGPNGYLMTYTAAANANGAATFTGIANPPAVGSYAYTATQGTITSTPAGEMVIAAPLTIVANSQSRLFDTANPQFTYSFSGFVNGDTQAVVSGVPALSTTAVRDSPAGMYPVSIGFGTLSASNYVLSLVSGNLTVTGGVPQAIIFVPLPNFTSGASYQLTARTTSGLPVTYTVTGNATISGSTLTVTAPGAVTVTAASGANASYAAAPNVSRSFTAQ